MSNAGDYEVDEYGFAWDENDEIVGYHADGTDIVEIYLPDNATDIGLPEAGLVMRRLRETDAKIVGLTAEFNADYEAIKKQYERRVKRLQNRRNWIVGAFGSALETLARSFIGDRKKNKYIDLSSGRLSLRTVPGGAITILDEAKAVAWAYCEAPQAVVEHDPTISKTELKKLGVQLPTELFAVSDEREEFKIDTGVKS